jgi:selenium metabolism protein YedF
MPSTNDETILDCRGLRCPQPLLQTKERYQQLEPGTALRVIVGSDNARNDVARFGEDQGARVTVSEQDGEHHVRLEPGAAAPSPPAPSTPAPPAPSGTHAGAAGTDPSRGEPDAARRPARDLVVFVTATGMGRGDDGLGETLMGAFLDTLSQFRDDLSHVLLVNGGARLAAADSPVLGQLHQLEELGAEILVCGTCLSHFGLTDQLAVGSVSNMYAILEVLAGAGRIIRP